MSVALVLWILAIIALTAALFVTMIRLVGGPNTLDRLISLDMMVAVAQGGIAVYIAWTKDTTPAAALVALAERHGRTVSFPDGAIAAIAAANGYPIATRDVAPFIAMGVDVVDPWDPIPPGP